VSHTGTGFYLQVLCQLRRVCLFILKQRFETINAGKGIDEIVAKAGNYTFMCR
jgi:hypothetical protein